MASSADDLQQLLQALSAQFRERLRKELPELAQQAAELANCTTPDSAVPLLQAVRGEIHAETAERRLLEGRVNGVESIFDQLRGARALIYFLIGSNLLAVLAVLVGIMR